MKNKILVYDDNCPLCSWYSGMFVKYGFLNADGRKAFSTLDPSLLSKIDFDRSRNEIPLLDTSTLQVVYGIDALLEILDSKIPLMKKAGNTPFINWFLRKLYKLVSFNRKVIVAQKCGPGQIDCAPDTNYSFRFSFMMISLFFNTIMLYSLHFDLFIKLSYYQPDIYQLQAAHFAFVIANCSLAFTFSKEKAYEYLGQVNMLALTVILLLTPILLISNLFYSEWFVTFYLTITAAFIFKEYTRRMEYAGVLPKNKWIVSMNLLCLTGFILFLFH